MSSLRSSLDTPKGATPVKPSPLFLFSHTQIASLNVLLDELKKKTSPSLGSLDHAALSLRSGRETGI